MFKFSFEWLKDYCGKEITPEEIFSILNIQGFEFQGKEEIGNDIVTAIEVKANRPDMLSHIGIAREIKAYKNELLPEIPKSSIKIDNNKFPVKINVEDNKICRRFCGITLKNINNKCETPDYIKTRLEALGINLVNPVVDIANYVMIDMGQPMHSYDISKIEGQELNIKKCNENTKVTTLAEKEAEIKKGDIVISDINKPLCLAGVIGMEDASVTSESKDIMLEAAIFDEVSVRLTSRAIKISTPSSFRFERGVNCESTLDILYQCAKMIQEVCGGEIQSEAFDYYPEKRVIDEIELSTSRTNTLLGTDLSSEQIIKYLEKYGFEFKNISDDSMKVIVPSYRLDVKKEVDLIEEVARAHGYDNIPIKMPVIATSYNRNKVWSNMDKIRNILSGLNFSETINYSFIPSDTMEALGIDKDEDIYSDVMLENPIAGAYSLMRPTLVYSLLNCLAYNYSIRNTDLALFELGRTFFKDSSYDTGCREVDTCGFIFSGTRIPKGWNCDKDVKYNYYDLLSYTNILMNSFGENFELKSQEYKFCELGTSYEIIVNNKKVGFIGELNKKSFGLIKNAKLIKDKIFYCEFYIDALSEKSKKLGFESKYPPIKRLYNFVYDKSISSEKIINTIKSSSDIIRNILVKDIYIDKNMQENTHAVLYEVTYCSNTETLTSEIIEKIENDLIKSLENKFGAILKS